MRQVWHLRLLTIIKRNTWFVQNEIDQSTMATSGWVFRVDEMKGWNLRLKGIIWFPCCEIDQNTVAIFGWVFSIDVRKGWNLRLLTIIKRNTWFVCNEMEQSTTSIFGWVFSIDVRNRWNLRLRSICLHLNIRETALQIRQTGRKKDTPHTHTHSPWYMQRGEGWKGGGRDTYTRHENWSEISKSSWTFFFLFF